MTTSPQPASVSFSEETPIIIDDNEDSSTVDANSSSGECSVCREIEEDNERYEVRPGTPYPGNQEAFYEAPSICRSCNNLQPIQTKLNYLQLRNRNNRVKRKLAVAKRRITSAKRDITRRLVSSAARCMNRRFIPASAITTRRDVSYISFKVCLDCIKALEDSDNCSMCKA
ncbi:hypothetical protein HgNV_095 [Homarus gammarus nudivirus]|uniref:Uncharacterized protein n=1 Tax=Homarus gammarus nudivirus TaxID=2509616 RepID=A0A411HBA9_9VIRU|nr:hypothetical protein KM727_gp95 [Homarus gammarus nudivirus]QBB28700.1 hypothetical protein HgNV_095 [Homarus gammarus nudivirus]